MNISVNETLVLKFDGKMKYWIFLLPLFLGNSCSQEQGHNGTRDHDHHEHDEEAHHAHHEPNGGNANAHMHKSSFEDLVKRFEDTERMDWQKPNEVIALLGNVNGERILDIGAGTGYFSFRLAEVGAEVVAADIDQRFLDFIQRRIDSNAAENVIPKLVELDDPLMRDEAFDKVIIVDTYHHIEDRPNYFAKVLKGMKNGGQLWVIDFKKKETPHGPPPHIRVSHQQVEKELREAGFSAIEVNEQLLDEQFILSAHKVAVG